MIDEDGNEGVWFFGVKIKIVLGVGLGNGVINWSWEVDIVFEEGSLWLGILGVGYGEVLVVCVMRSRIGGRLLSLDF